MSSCIRFGAVFSDFNSVSCFRVFDFMLCFQLGACFCYEFNPMPIYCHSARILFMEKVSILQS